MPFPCLFAFLPQRLSRTFRFLQRHGPFLWNKKLTRWNSGNAATDFFREEVGITQLQFNVGVSVSGIATALAEASPTRRPLTSEDI